MQEWKQIVAILSIIALVGWTGTYIVMFAPMLNDSEFDSALQWAEEAGIEQTEQIEEYPFSLITRADAVSRYIATARQVGLMPHNNDRCTFTDIDGVATGLQQQILLACQYGFFKGSNGEFVPNGYLTKAGSLVALVRGFYPGVEFASAEPYWEPYVNFAYQEGITKRESTPYLMYLISKYELLLQLYRVAQLRGNR